MKKSIFLSILMVVGVAILISLPSVFWFSRDEVLAHGPFFPWPDWVSSWWVATRYLYTWADGALGSINTEPSGFLYAAILTLITQVSRLVNLGQGGVFFFGYIAIFLSMVYLMRSLRQNYFASIFAGAVYLLNPIIFSGLPIEIINIKLIPFNIATPLLVAILVKIFSSRNWPKQIALFILIAFIPGSLSYSSLQYFSIHLLIILIFCSVELIQAVSNRQRIRELLFKSTLILSLFFLVNIYWLLPLLSNIGDSFISRAEPGISDARLLNYLSSTIPNSLRMIQYPGQVEVSPWFGHYHTPLVIIISLGIILTGLSALLMKKNRENALFPATLLLTGLFLSKGIDPFFSGLGKLIFLSFPYITRLFRNPTYFGSIVAFSASVLFGLFLGYYFDRLIKNKNLIILGFSIAVITLFLSVHGWQFITGALIKTRTDLSLNQTTVVPSSFVNATQFIRKDPEDFRIISIPMFVSGRGNSVTYNWDGIYIGVGPDGVWSAKPTFVPTGLEVTDFIRAIFAPRKALISQEDWIEELRHKNVRYVLLHQDANIPIYGLEKNNEQLRDEINSFIRNNPYLIKVYGNDQIEVFRLKDEYFRPHIYTETVGPIVTYQKVNPTKYEINVKNATTSLKLIFLESFSSQWKIKLDEGGKELRGLNHERFDDYANSWVISPQDVNGRSAYKLTLEYAPQKIALVGWGISIITLIVASIIWLFYKK